LFLGLLFGVRFVYDARGIRPVPPLGIFSDNALPQTRMPFTPSFTAFSAWLRRLIFTILLATIIVLGVRPQIVALTSTGAARGLYDLHLPGLDLGIDVYPAKPGRAGYLQVWCYPDVADDITILFAIPGAAALPLSADTLHA